MNAENASPTLSTSSRHRFARLRGWWRQLLEASDTTILGLHAEAHALAFLKQNLSPVQRRQFEMHSYFDVTGGHTGTTYRVHYSRQMNIQQLDQGGACVRSLCFMPKGGVPIADLMLAQKLALELFERDALAIANKINSDPFGRSVRRSP
jgi:hypothetical protein